MIHLAPKDLSLGSLRLGWPQPHTLLLEVLTHISRVAEEGGHMHFFHIHCPFSSNILPPKQGQNEIMCLQNNHQIKLKSSNFTQVVIIIYFSCTHSLSHPLHSIYGCSPLCQPQGVMSVDQRDQTPAIRASNQMGVTGNRQAYIY